MAIWENPRSGIAETNEMRVALFGWKCSTNVGEIFIRITPTKYGIIKTKAEIANVLSKPRCIRMRFGAKLIRIAINVVVNGFGAAKNKL